MQFGRSSETKPNLGLALNEAINRRKPSEPMFVKLKLKVPAASIILADVIIISHFMDMTFLCYPSKIHEIE